MDEFHHDFINETKCDAVNTIYKPRSKTVSVNIVAQN